MAKSPSSLTLDNHVEPIRPYSNYRLAATYSKTQKEDDTIKFVLRWKGIGEENIEQIQGDVLRTIVHEVQVMLWTNHDFWMDVPYLRKRLLEIARNEKCACGWGAINWGGTDV